MKFLKWISLAAFSVLLLLILLVFISYLITEHQRTAVYTIQVSSLHYDPEDEELLARGEHVATIRQCRDCHGANLGGKITYEDHITGLVVATNLITGKGGIGSGYSDKDFLRAIRHGVNNKGESVVFMPSDEYVQIDRNDLTALIAYIRSVPPVNNELPTSRIGLLARIGHILLPDVELFPRRFIDHSFSIPEPVAERSMMELGEYLSATCGGCHKPDFSGGRITGVPPDWPEAPDLTPDGPIGSWTEEEFFTAMRTGVTPAGHQMDPGFSAKKVVSCPLQKGRRVIQDSGTSV